MNTLTFITQLACRVGDTLAAQFQLSGSKARRKADQSVVTDADVAADRLIAAAIAEAYPHEAIVSEELHPTLTENSEAAWVVDPLDGTTNFSMGLHHWGVSLARLVGGWPDTAAVYFPLLNELYTAQRGEGAWLNGERLRLQAHDPERPAAFFSCCTRAHRRYRIQTPYKTRIFGSTAYTLCVTARGAAVLGFEVRPKIWDIAAGWLVVREAGGVVETLNGERPFPLAIGENYTGRSYPVLAAATGDMLMQARQWIQPRER